ncbi:MAG: type VI secretion system tip protein VgrG [Burkholderiales bacterium]|nr:type VI secretion system tip protein VgrG [Burkholderiales bacterium]
MNLFDIAHDLLARAFNQDNRPQRLRFSGQHGKLFEGMLLPQRIDITSGVCDDLTAHITCLTSRSDLPLVELMGLPMEVQFVTDMGELQRYCVVITNVCQGQSDGSLTTVQLTGRDIFAVMEGRRSNRIYLNKSVLDIARLKLDSWRGRNPAVALAFEYALLNIDENLFPQRALTFQCHQNDADFLRNLFRRNGIAWFMRALPSSGDNDSPAQQLVLFIDAYELPENSAGPVKYHRRDGTEPRDTVSLLAPAYTLVSGALTRSSWDHESARVDVVSETSAVDQGTSGNRLSASLVDARIELPHAGDTWADHERLTRVDMTRHEGRAHCLHGIGGVRAQSVCEWNRFEGHPVLDTLSREQREYITIRLQIWAEGSLPKELNERAQALMCASEAGIDGWVATPEGAAQDGVEAGIEHRYTNRFIAVRRGAPIVPSWDPETDLPHMPLMTATVISEDDRPVWCDELGRVKVRIHGLDPVDDDEKTWDTTAWVRVNFLWCGPGFGVIFPLRAGMEVSLGFEQGDPSRPMIVGSRYAYDNPPPQFDHFGSLPNNAALSGVVTRELMGQRQQQLRFNDTTGNISTQLATDHGCTQFNAGSLSTPMNEGKTEPRGEGFELRTDESGAIRTAKSLLISAWKRLQASGNQLSADEHIALMQDCLNLFKVLGDYAAQNHGLAVDGAGQTELSNDIQAAAAGSNVDPQSQGGKPTLSLTAPDGIAITSPKTLVSYSGVNIDSIAKQHYQITTGQRYNLNAGQGIGLFSHHNGIKAISHQGPLITQSQNDETRIESAKDITLAAQNTIRLMAKNIQIIATDGSFITLADALTLASTGVVAIKGSAFPHSGAASMGAELPKFSSAPVDQKMVLRYGPGKDALVAANRRYEAILSDGSKVQGVTDAQGRAQVLQSDSMNIADITLINDPRV